MFSKVQAKSRARKIAALKEQQERLTAELKTAQDEDEQAKHIREEEEREARRDEDIQTALRMSRAKKDNERKAAEATR
jgi:hypothetical protein